MIIKLSLRKKDDLLKHWFEYALEEEVNVSSLIGRAVQYYQLTNRYLQIGTINNDKDIPDSKKNIYYAKDSHLALQIKEWKSNSLHPSTEIKRILRNGIKQSGVCSVINEEEAYGLLEKEMVRINKDNDVLKREIKGYEKEESRNNGDVTVRNDVKEKQVIKPKRKEQSDFIMSMIPPGCGLGED